MPGRASLPYSLVDALRKIEPPAPVPRGEPPFPARNARHSTRCAARAGGRRVGINNKRVSAPPTAGLRGGPCGPGREARAAPGTCFFAGSGLFCSRPRWRARTPALPCNARAAHNPPRCARGWPAGGDQEEERCRPALAGPAPACGPNRVARVSRHVPPAGSVLPCPWTRSRADRLSFPARRVFQDPAAPSCASGFPTG